jgi:hypothetical protein
MRADPFHPAESQTLTILLLTLPGFCGKYAAMPSSSAVT